MHENITDQSEFFFKFSGTIRGKIDMYRSFHS